MDKRLLESFVYVYRSGSIVEAADRLHISQSALSRRLAELQTQLGTTLFQPTGRGIAATPNAQRLLPLALSALEAIGTFEEAARRNAGPDPVHVTIAATAHTIEGLVVERAAALMRRHPNYAIQFVEAGGVEIEDMVLNGKVSIGITARPRFSTGLTSLPIARLKVVALSSIPFDETEVETGVELKSLCERELIALDRRYQSRVTIDAALRLLQVSPHIAHETSSVSVATALARAGLGTALIPSGTRRASRTDRRPGSRPDQLSRAHILANGVELGMDLVAIWDPTLRWRAEVEEIAQSMMMDL